MAKDAIKSRIATWSSSIPLLGIDTDGAVKKLFRAVLAAGVSSELNIDSGEWTPSVVVSGDLTSITGRLSYYIRVGDYVLFVAQLQASHPGSPITSSTTIDVPVASNFSSFQHLAGAGVAANDSSPGSVLAFADTSNDAMQINWASSTSESSKSVAIAGGYKVL